MAEKKFYFNKHQRLTQLVGANTTVAVAERRTDITDSITISFVLRNFRIEIILAYQLRKYCRVCERRSSRV